MVWYDIIPILETLIPSVLVLLTAWLLIRAFLRNEGKRREDDANTAHKDRLLKMKLDTRKELIPIRLQAYERLLLFLERNRLSSLFLRVRKTKMTAAELQAAMANTVREEYEHNLSQQLYISPEAWKLLSEVKDHTINIIVTVSPEEGEDALAFGSRLLENNASAIGDLCDKAVAKLVEEVNLTMF